MNAEPDILVGDKVGLRGVCAACPLRLAMERIARTALRQYVLYLEGELQPRLELLRDLEAASALERLVRERVCVLSRSSALEPEEIASAVAALGLKDLEAALNTCGAASECPLDV
jgi:hypothetical protein